MVMSKDVMTPEERFNATVRMEPVDRVLCAPLQGQYPGQFAGLTNAEFLWDMEKNRKAIDAMADAYPMWDMRELSSDIAAPFASRIGLMKSKFPGRDLPENAEYQNHELETLSREDYDLLLSQGFFPYMLKFWQTSNEISQGEVLAALHEVTEFNRVEMQHLASRGQIPYTAILGGIPFDLLMMARSFPQFIKDLFQVGDKVEAAVWKVAEGFSEMCIGAAKSCGINRVMVGGGRSNTSFIGPRQFKRFVWPQLKMYLEKMIAADLTPILHFDADWTGNLEFFLELPKGKFVLELDGFTDIFRAKEILGGHCALMGDMKSPLFATGTPDDVDAYAKKLIGTIGKGGGLIYSSGCSIPINARHENVKAFFDAVEKYGRYN
ncbi:MAG: hemE 1 [Holophagaceae bacterium]|nr:hemE 1 [Holophagaceae bacterium]